MSRVKAGVAASCLLLLAGGTSRAQGVVPGGWDGEFGSQSFASGWPGGRAGPGPGFGPPPVGFGAARVAVPGAAGGAGAWGPMASPTTFGGLGGLARTIEWTAFRRRGR